MKGPETQTNFYVLRLGGGLYELREALSKPTKVVSKLTKSIEVETYKIVEDPKTGAMTGETIKVPKPFIMKQTYFSGGKLIGHFRPTYKFLTDIKLVVPTDTMVRLTPAQFEKVYKELHHV
jgi:hypothetical protein